MRWVHGLVERLRCLLTRARVERELTEEIEFHLARETARLRAGGMNPEEAARAARRAFGRVDAVRELHRDERGSRWLTDFAGDVRFGLRGLRSQPALAAVAVLALALGIGGNAAAFSVLDALLLKPLPVTNPDDLVVVWQVRDERTDRQKMTAYDVEFYREHVTSFAGMTGILAPQRVALITDTEPEQATAALVTSDFFEVLGAGAARGRVFTSADERTGSTNVAVLSHAYWTRRFGADPDTVGRTVNVNGQPTLVVGVMPETFRLDFPAMVEMWLPRVYSDSDLTTLELWSENVVGRLAPGATLQQAREELESVSARAYEAAPRNFTAHAFNPVPLHEEIVAEVEPALATIFAAVALVLLIACANVANLLLARNTQRADELALRAALGAGRGRLTRQLLAEYSALAAAGAVAALGIGYAMLRAMLLMAPPDLPRLAEVGMDLRVVGFTAAIAIGATLLFGTLPALRGGRSADVGPTATRGARGQVGRGERTLRLLVAAESALVVVLVFAAGAMLQRYQEIATTRTGFAQEARVAAKVVLPSTRYVTTGDIGAFVTAAEERIRRIPGVTAAGAAWTLPLAGRAITVSVPPVEGETPREIAIPTGWDGITPGYLDAAGVPIVEGRGFGPEDVASANPHALVINETLAQELFGDEPAAGRFLANAAMRWQIIGVAGDSVHLGLDQKPRPHVYQAQAQVTFAWRHFEFVVEGAVADPLALAPAIRRAIAEVDPEQPVADIRTLEQVAAASIHAERYLLVLLGAFGAVALALGAIGIYGVVGYGVARRRRELGLRMTLGARRRDIRWLVVRGGLGPVGAGVAIGALAAAAASDGLGALLAGAQPPLGALLIPVAAVVLLAAGAAIIGPTRRATRADPMQSLREE